MRVLVGVLLAWLGLASASQAAVGVRLVMGLTDSGAVTWDGEATAAGARIVGIEPWWFDTADAIRGNSWKCSTHRARAFSGGAASPFVANGVIVWLEGDNGDARLDVRTAQGNFSLRLADIPYGAGRKFLDNRVLAERVPPSTRITSTPEEQDFPAIAVDKSGNLWLAYIEFRHHPQHDRLRHILEQRPRTFDDWGAPPGGDQVLVRRRSGDGWGPPIEITRPGGDLNRPAIAVDGSGRPWVFWSENRNGNFDIRARAIENGKPGPVARISSEPGSDIDAVAASDSQGRIWVAWQGWRDGRASIFTAVQGGNRFSEPEAVSSTAGNQWNPVIAADREGRVTVAWDSYANGNYDVFCRTATAPGRWGAEVAIADSARYEAYPSIAYAPDGKLWIAYEEGPERWGKNFGAYDTRGTAVYQGRAIRLVARDRAGNMVTTASDVSAVLPGVPGERVDEPGAQNSTTSWLSPDPDGATRRKKSKGATTRPAPRNSLPRLLADSSGRLWLAFRSAFPQRWSVIGSVWTEYVVSYDGHAWNPPVYLAHTDNLLDNRPALASAKSGELIVVGASDGRADFPAGLPDAATQRGIIQHATGSMPSGLSLGPAALIGNPAGHDPYNNDLYAAAISLAPIGEPLPVKAAGTARMSAADPGENAAIQRIRNYRIKLDSGDLRIVRGEFHRHSEISMDGARDGTIFDQWRYLIDAAGMDWAGCCDHDNGGGREYSWWITQKLTDMFYAPGHFAPLFSYERSVQYPEGHRNVVFAQRGVRPLPRLPRSAEESTGHAPDTQMLYEYLRQFGGIVASHTSATTQGTDWRDNDPALEPVVEIYQGDRQNYEMPGAPRSNSEEDSINGWRPKGFIDRALERGYKLGFQASSDHISTHISYCNILVKKIKREAVLTALRQRHVYGSTDNILADVRSGSHIMGDSFTTHVQPELKITLIGTAPFAKVDVIKGNRYVYSLEPKSATVEFTWRDTAARAGEAIYYYVRGEQDDGEIVWASPLWIRYD